MYYLAYWLIFETRSIYGILYLYLVTIPLLYGPDPVFGLFSYGWQHGLTGLAYLGPGIGSVIGTFICAKYLNRSYVYMAKRHTRKTGSNEPQPESRMLFLQLGKIIVPVGLVMFAWSAQKQAHWILPLMGAAIFAVGMCMAYVCIQTYLVDVYEEYGASALAAVIFTRSVVSCVLSIMGFKLFQSLGYAWYVHNSFIDLGTPRLRLTCALQGNYVNRFHMRRHAAYSTYIIHLWSEVAEGAKSVFAYGVSHDLAISPLRNATLSASKSS